MPRVFASAAVALALALAAAASLASAVPPGPVVARGERVGGLTPVQWEVLAWQWQLAWLTVPRGAPDPATCVTDGQIAPVWFLGANFRRYNSVRALCTVPAGRFILIPSPSIDCSSVEPPPFHALTDIALERCARAGWRGARARHAVTLDGVRLRPPGHIVATPAFSFVMPGNDNYLGVPGSTAGRVATVGYFDMLRPLPPGAHTLVRTSQYVGGAPRRTTWYLVVA